MRLDKGNRGTLCLDDIKNITESEFGKKYKNMTCQDWEQVIQECDMNGDGVIDFQEFISACVDRKALVHKKDVRQAF